MLVWLEELSAADLPRAGGKGANLGELARAGLPVPPGFVVTVPAYRAHLAASGAADGAVRALGGLDPADLGALEQAADAIRGQFLAAPPDPALAAEVAAAYAGLARRLGSDAAPPVAVRSSATAEDLPAASFAGQQETYLNIRGADALLDAVRRCWASLWTPRAIAYRARMGYDHMAVGLAVVVQAMVPAQAAGVMFTANPLNGRRDQAVVNAAYGLGESVVAGAATPDTFVLAKEPPAVRERQLGAKACRIVGTDRGVREEEVPPDWQARFCLDDDALLELAALAGRVERHFGAPQDTEWALAGGQIYLLQSRPITALPPAAAGDHAAAAPTAEPPAAPRLTRQQRRQAETNRRMRSGLGDHFPDPLKPLDLDTMLRLALTGIFGPARAFGIVLPPISSLIQEQPDGGFAFIPPRPRPTPAILLAPFRLARMLAAKPLRAWARLAPALEALPARLARQPGPAELAAIVRAVEQPMIARFREVFFPGALWQLILEWLVSRAAGRDGAPAVLQQLYSGLPYYTARVNQALGRLAGVAAGHPATAALLRSADPAGVARQLDQLPADSPFPAALSAFLAEYGTRPVSSMVPVPGYPTWADEPAAVIALLQVLLPGPGAPAATPADSAAADSAAAASAITAGTAGAATAGAATAGAATAGAATEAGADWVRTRDAVGRQLAPWWRPLFRPALERTRQFIVAREESLAVFERISAGLRAAALALGQDMASRGLLRRADDVLYLTLEELARPPVERIPLRRAAFDRLVAAAARGRHWLEVTGATGEAAGPVGAATAGAATASAAAPGPVLRGLPASPGRATGVARIIRGPADFPRLRPGEVLVCPATSPAWTPLFAVAAAVVTDTGGPLSHAAIVAREYGIPAVLGTAHATRRFPDGVPVVVDGTAGWAAPVEDCP